MKNKAIIFDLDGVIVDTAKYHFIAWKKIADELGIPFSQKENELLKGVSRVKSLDIILAWDNRQISDAKKEELLTQKNQHYLKLIMRLQPEDMLPGIQELLRTLKHEKIPFALGSASKNARKILKALKIEDLFTAIVDGNDVSKAKPDPEVFLLAAKKMNKAPENCIVIEDAQAGIEAAKNAGMYSIGIGDEQILAQADIVLPETKYLNLKLIKDLL